MEKLWIFVNNPKSLDYILLSILALIWTSAFFNIKIATYSYGPITIAFFRILLGAIPVIFVLVDTFTFSYVLEMFRSGKLCFLTR